MATLTTDSLVRIASAGGGLIVDARGKSTDNLIRIAAAASISGAKITIKYYDGIMTDNLVRIAAAGKGCVVFDLSE